MRIFLVFYFISAAAPAYTFNQPDLDRELEACLAGMSWGCLEHGKLNEAYLDGGKPGQGLPPIVVPPVIAAFDPFAVAIAAQISRIRPSPRDTGAYIDFISSPKWKKAAEEAQKSYATGCRWANAVACQSLGNFFRFRLNDRASAHRVFESGCLKDRGESCFTLADLSAGNKRLARELYEKACLLHHADACMHVAALTGLPKWYSFACDEGKPWGCYFAGHRSTDRQLAMHYFEKGCALNDIGSCWEAARAHLRQKHFLRSLDLASRAFQMGGSQGESKYFINDFKRTLAGHRPLKLR